MLRYHHMLMRYGTGSQVLLPRRCNLFERNTTCAFRKWWSKMFIFSTCNPNPSDLKRKQSDLFDTNISKDEGKLGPKPKLEAVHSGKPLEPFDGSSRIKISGVDFFIPVTPIPVIPTESIAPLPEDELPIGVYEPSTEKVLRISWISSMLNLEIQCFPSIGRIPSFGKDLFDNRSRLDDWKGVCSPDDDEVESIRRANAPSLVDKNDTRVFGKAILDKVSHTPFDGLPSLKGDFYSLYAIILQRGVNITHLESKSHSRQTSAEEHDSYRMEVQGKLNETSHWLNTEGSHYEAKMAELKSKERASTSKIDILNAIEVIDVATKASLEKVEAYIKESFEDLKNFQWNP
ncbi:LOW QUALITY PROTEIN: hypothetical protein Cgig2_015359 [Carnegiea gigantea]|uniref:Uncharacterized protein n=1 Tax=Carnegiea gigantea TaxID=171969 RepID=A0A9Q1QDF1_9CARY|nr:LOW QUALITY PROTEIN: hypothetical protein Cgig2_015359 [Carnegiea gigantea]